MKKNQKNFDDNPLTPNIRAQIPQMRQYPVSPTFKSRVLTKAALNINNSVWDYLQLFTVKNLQSALVVLVVLVILMLAVPTVPNDSNVTSATSDYTYLILEDSTAQHIDTNEQALMFALSN